MYPNVLTAIVIVYKYFMIVFLCQVFELLEGRPFYTLHGHKAPPMAVAFSPSGGHFASVGADDQVSDGVGGAGKVCSCEGL